LLFKYFSSSEFGIQYQYSKISLHRFGFLTKRPITNQHTENRDAEGVHHSIV